MSTTEQLASRISHLRENDKSLHLFSKRDQAYLSDPSQFKSYLSCLPNENHFAELIEAKSNSYTQDQRDLLVEVLKEQASEIGVSDETVAASLKLLKQENTYVIITAHQPCLFTGPLYFIYKIASAIALAQRIDKQFSDKNVLPVFVIGSEDHDFEEINHFHLFNKKIEWQNDEQGAVGHMRLQHLDVVIEQVKDLLGDEPFAEEILHKLRTSYRPEITLAQATAAFVYSVFEGRGVLVADLDDARLKASAQSIFEKELIERKSKELVETTQSELFAAGFSSQVYARDLNLFSIQKGQRERILFEDNLFRVNGESKNEEQMLDFLHTQPEAISPNVILRPVYQQYVLPGLAYIGGGAEVAYWMEIHHVFKSYDLPFPMLVRRDSALWVKPYTYELMRKIQLNIDDLFLPLHEAQEKYLAKHVDDDWQVRHIDKEFEQLFQRLFEEIEKVDAGLVKMAKGFQGQQKNFIDKLESKLKKSLKTQNDVAMGRMSKIWDDLFPNGGLQERRMNFISVYSRLGSRFIDSLIEHFDPLLPGLHIFTEERGR